MPSAAKAKGKIKAKGDKTKIAKAEKGMGSALGSPPALPAFE